MSDRIEDRSLAGKVAVVTGAGRGIGKAEAIALARESAGVVVNNRAEVPKGPRAQRQDERALNLVQSPGVVLPHVILHGHAYSKTRSRE
jgi:NAD(P)-dependent dehydrogenase (short-subunit alcohol dehydrogenase family)